MSRRHWAIAILVVWVVSLGWLVKREVFRSTGARLAEAALSVAPGAMFYRVDLGGQQVGFRSATLDTLRDSIRVEDVYMLDVPALGRLYRTSARSVAILSRTLRLRRVDVTFDGEFGRFDAHGSVLGDSILRVSIVSGEDSQVTRIPLSGPITIPSLLPLRLAFSGELEAGRSYSGRLFDPVLLAGRDVTVRVAAESTLVVADSADLDSTTMVWVPNQFDTVRAFRIDEELQGIPTSSWIDAQGRVVRATVAAGVSTERSAFEIAYENFRRRDTARVARNSILPPQTTGGGGGGAIVPLTALAAGITARAEPALPRLRLRVTTPGRLDTLDIVRATTLQASASPYRLPSRDTALARWLLPEPLIQSRDPRIASQARLILNGGRERSPSRAAARLAEWVHEHVRPARDAGVPSAERVLENGRGDCNAAATLFVALARSAGLPARTISGLLYQNERFYYHAWAEVYLGTWVAIDPSLNQFPADARHVRFAVGGLARQVELVPLIGRLTLEVL
jgi:hypothetical protein